MRRNVEDDEPIRTIYRIMDQCVHKYVKYDSVFGYELSNAGQLDYTSPQ